jgi:CheY-like chemotaxis protein
LISSPVPEKKTALLIDDDHAFVVGVRSFLMDSGYYVLTAGDGGKALGLVESLGRELSLVMVDIALPIVGGYEVIANLAKRRAPGMKVVAMTAAANEYYLEIARQVGAHAALQQPPARDPQAAAQWCESLRAYL